MLDKLNPIRKEDISIKNNPKLALEKLQNLYFKDIKNFMILAQELQNQLSRDSDHKS